MTKRSDDPAELTRIPPEDVTDLATVNPNEFFVNDLTRLTITGEIPAGPNFKKVNFVQSTLFEITATGVDFSECDFKDTLLKGARFSRCSFNGGMFATSFFMDCLFEECTFYNLAASNSEFHRTSFINSDLENIIVKSSKFRRCLFRNCSTTNKIAEMSTLDETHFERTEIQLETITENFGLRRSDLEGSLVRSGRTREDYTHLTTEQLKNYSESGGLTAIERLRLEYFLVESLIGGSAVLDEALDLSAWIETYQNPGTFVELLNSFSEFLVQLYDSQRSTVHPILLLHYVTSSIRDESLNTSFIRVAQSLGGTHMILSRIVEEYLVSLNQAFNSLEKPTLTLLVEGSYGEPFYQKELEPWMVGGAHLSRFEPHNSPFVLEIVAESISSLVPLLALFLATRTRVEILRIQSRDKASRSYKSLPSTEQPVESPKTSASQSSAPESVFLFDLGAKAASDDSYQLRLKSLLPGSLLFDFRLQVSTQLVGRMRKALIALSDSPSKKGK